MRDWVAGLMADLVKHWAPEIVAQLLARIDPEDIGSKVQPHIMAIMHGLPSHWRSAYAIALHKLADAIQASVPPRG